MERKPSVRKNFLYRTLYEILVVICPLLTTPHITRTLGADGVGIYSHTSSLMTYFTLLAALGTVSYGSREIARHRDDKKEYSKLFWEIELMTVLSSLIAFLGWFVVIIVDQSYRIFYLALTPLLFSTMFDISWFFTGLEQIRSTVIKNSIVKLTGVVLIYLLVRKRDDILLYFLINTISMMLGSLSMWLYLPKILVKVDRNSLNIARHFKQTIVYFVPTIATSVYTVLDKTLIHMITGNDSLNGYYEEANKIVHLIRSVVFTSINHVVGSRISYLFAKGKTDEIKNRINRSMDYILLLGYGCTFGLVGVAANFVPLFLGDNFIASVELIYYMSPLIIIIGISNCLGNQYYTPSGRRSDSSKIIITGAVINLIFNCVLIPYLGAKGAIVGSLIAESVITYLYVRFSSGFMKWKFIWNNSWKRLISGCVMCAAVYFIGSIQVESRLLMMCIQIVSGVALYVLLLLLFQDSMLLSLMRVMRSYILKLRKRI